MCCSLKRLSLSERGAKKLLIVTHPKPVTNAKAWSTAP